MHEHIASDQLIGHHRTREDYAESPQNTLQFGYGDHRYTKMAYELLREDDVLQEKTLAQLVEDFSL
jgi:oligoribonuclease NrnB/cAMP/cGMP phosphodiesterase (DHH superfamily)